MSNKPWPCKRSRDQDERPGMLMKKRGKMIVWNDFSGGGAEGKDPQLDW